MRLNSVSTSAVHVAFPAPSKDAVGSFFISALKAGGKIFGEPKLRDSQSGYYSAAIIDFDGNSIEAVYRPGSASAAASEAGGPTIALLENGSVVSKSSKASTIKAESVAPPRSEAKSRAVSKAPTIVERAAPSVVSHQSQGPPPSYGAQTQVVEKADDGSKAAKTIVGTLIGAAAGAAIAYAMVKGDSQSENETPPPPQYTTEYPQIMGPPSQVSQEQNQPAYRAIEAPPSRSVYTASNPRSTVSRSVASKNPRASTVYEGTEFFHDENGRRASEGSIFSIPEDLPLRAIEYPPPSNASQQRNNYSPSSFISSYAADKPRGVAGSTHSASTIKAPSQASTQRRHSYDDRDARSSHSQRSHASRAPSAHSHHSASRSVKSQAKDHDGAGSTASSTRTARNIPLPAGSSATYYSANGSQGGKSYVSAREVPLPDSVVDLDVDSHVTPDDSISQIGGHTGRSTHSHHSKHSKAGSRASKHSSRSKFEEPVRPADSVSQVSRASQRTVKAGGSNAASKVGSRRGSQVV